MDYTTNYAAHEEASTSTNIYAKNRVNNNNSSSALAAALTVPHPIAPGMSSHSYMATPPFHGYNSFIPPAPMCQPAPYNSSNSAPFSGSQIQSGQISHTTPHTTPYTTSYTTQHFPPYAAPYAPYTIPYAAPNGYPYPQVMYPPPNWAPPSSSGTTSLPSNSPVDVPPQDSSSNDSNLSAKPPVNVPPPASSCNDPGLLSNPPVNVPPQDSSYMNPNKAYELTTLKVPKPKNEDKLSIQTYYDEVRATLQNSLPFAARSASERYLQNNILYKHKKLFRPIFTSVQQDKEPNWDIYRKILQLIVNASPSPLTLELETLLSDRCRMSPDFFIETWMEELTICLYDEPTSKELERILITLIRRFKCFPTLARAFPEHSLALKDMSEFHRCIYNKFECQDVKSMWQQVTTLFNENAYDFAYQEVPKLESTSSAPHARQISTIYRRPQRSRPSSHNSRMAKTSSSSYSNNNQANRKKTHEASVTVSPPPPPHPDVKLDKTTKDDLDRFITKFVRLWVQKIYSTQEEPNTCNFCEDLTHRRRDCPCIDKLLQWNIIKLNHKGLITTPDGTIFSFTKKPHLCDTRFLSYILDLSQSSSNAMSKSTGSNVHEPKFSEASPSKNNRSMSIPLSSLVFRLHSIS